MNDNSTYNKKNICINKEFINTLFIQSPPLYSVIYIYMLSNQTNNTFDFDLSKLSLELNIMETDIVNSLKHFSTHKLINVTRDLESNVHICFLDSLVDNKSLDNTVILNKKPDYTIDEIGIYKNSSNEFSSLLQQVETILGKPLKQGEISTVLSFLDWLQLSTDLIVYLFTYCASTQNRNIKYIESVALSWHKDNITTVEDAKKHTSYHLKDYKEILNALGQSNNPAPAEIEFMNKWLNHLNFPLEIILEGCDLTVLSTDKHRFKYLNGILEKWKEKNVSTIEDIKQIQIAFTKDKKKNFKHKKNETKKYSNYIKHNFDYDSFKTRSIEKLKNEF